MRTVLNAIARVLLVLAAIGLGFTAAADIMNAVNAFTGWFIWNDPNWWSTLWRFVLGCISAIMALVALVAAIRGRRSYRLAFFAIIIMVNPIYTLVTMIQAGTVTWNWDTIWPVIVKFAVPLVYFAGCLLLVKPNEE